MKFYLLDIKVIIANLKHPSTITTMNWTDSHDLIGFDTAQICLYGHITNDAIHNMPKFSEKYCKRCGEKTITTCPNCNEEIRGALFDNLDGIVQLRKTPAYCQNCGKPFPWTETTIQAAIELSVEDGNLNESEVVILRESIADLVSDSPRTQLGAARFKRIMGKVGVETAKAIRDIVVSIVSESAKTIIWPDK
ncbi:MAG: DUF2321 domain-containing protein [Planctomycetes bacterium]|nr:DUF2321 domain-containing protein [Planctomycetota bacterium]